MDWLKTISALGSIMSSMIVTGSEGETIEPDKAFAEWLEYTKGLRNECNYLFLIGNGASSSMASHFATDITKNGGIKTHVFTDSSLLTAVGNDYCFEELYVKPLQWYAKSGDILVAISSSGNSANIVQGCEYARSIGMKIVTLSAMNSDNRLRSSGNLNFYITAKTYGHAESVHAIILHHWMDILEECNKNGQVRS